MIEIKKVIHGEKEQSKRRLAQSPRFGYNDVSLADDQFQVQGQAAEGKQGIESHGIHRDFESKDVSVKDRLDNIRNRRSQLTNQLFSLKDALSGNDQYVRHGISKRIIPDGQEPKEPAGE